MSRPVKLIFLLGVAVALSGCTLAYQPPLDVPAAPYVFAGAPTASEPIRVEDVTAPDTVITSRGGSFTFNNKLAQYGDAVVASLERELEKQGFRVAPDAVKVIRIDVIDVEMAYPKKYRCDINLKVDVDGKEVGIATDSAASINHSDAIDASVADAVRRIMGQKDVVAYLTEKP